MNLAIIEPEAYGHHMILYVRAITRAALGRGWKVLLITTEQATREPPFKRIVQEFQGSLTIELIPHTPFPRQPSSWMKLLSYQLSQYRVLADASKELKLQDRCDAIYLVNFDYVDKVLGLLGSPFGSKSFSGMLMGVGFHRKAMGLKSFRSRNDLLYKWLFQRLLSNKQLHAVTVIDEPFFEYMKSIKPRNIQKIRFIPDASGLANHDISYDQARKKLNIIPSQTMILVYGALTERKGIEELLAAILSPHCPKHILIMLAGCQSASLKAILKQDRFSSLVAEGRLIEVNEFLDDENEFTVFRAADIVWLGYREFYGMSGVWASAISLGVPVIACRQGVIGWATKKYGCGEVVEVSDSSEIIASILRIEMDARLRNDYRDRGLSIAAKHNSSQFGKGICDAIS